MNNLNDFEASSVKICCQITDSRDIKIKLFNVLI